jgi:hypothetical protein
VSICMILRSNLWVLVKNKDIHISSMQNEPARGESGRLILDLSRNLDDLVLSCALWNN